MSPQRHTTRTPATAALSQPRHRSPRAWSAGLTASAIAMMIAVSGCGSTSTTAVGPSPIKCEVTLSGASVIGPGGGTGTISVATGPECTWSASTQAPWITRLTPRTGQGPGQVEFEASSTAVTAPRQGDVVVNDARIQIQQDLSLCVFDVAPSAVSAASSGGSRTLTVTTANGCPWTAASGVNWVAIAAGATASGNGSVVAQVGVNAGDARTGSMTVAGRTIAVSQSAGGTGNCTYAINPTLHNATASGGSSTVAVTSEFGCAWTATSDVPWVVVTSGVNGNGNGTVNFNVDTSTAPARTGHLTIGGQTFTVNQASGCSYSTQPASQSVGAGAASGSTTISTLAGCTWTASSQAPWIAITSGNSGNGGGTITFSIAANISPARTGTVTVANQTFTVHQASGCTYAVQPVDVPATSAGGFASVTVSSGPGCPWTAVSHAPWIDVSPGTATGDGAVGVAVQANPGPERSATVTIAGHTVTVTEASGCTFALSPTSQSFGFFGGTGSVTVSTFDGCAWTAVTNVTWITIRSGEGGTGPGTVVYAVPPLLFGGKRSGSITIGGQTFMVTQQN